MVHAGAAVGADNVHAGGHDFLDEALRRDAHHGGVLAAGLGIEGEAGDDQQAGMVFGGLDGGDGLLDGGHGFDDDHIGPARLQGDDLLFEGVDEIFLGFHAQRFHELARRPDAAQDILRIAGHLAGDAGGGPVDLGHPAVQAIMLQFVTGAAEGIGLDDIAAGGVVLAVDVLYLVRVLDAPQFRTLARLQAFGLQEGTHPTVTKQNFASFNAFQNI
ncbi:MAG: hypothetical protein BWY71_00511 [Planctomycetes bacterium ADurb.Bin412]|nr:MAG: hypothetical protein BWY71_00511 [Planctomycetes bacterium ADurb.Bin412]